VEVAARVDRGKEEGGTAARPVFFHPAGHVAVKGIAEVVPRVVIGRVDVNEVQNAHRRNPLAPVRSDGTG
jgi:hypothetical protein